jgi:Bacterial archaeo-eukaryotic release factor family 3
MNLFTSIPEREAIATVEFLPAVSIIMPFTPVITIKKNLEYNLKNVMGKVEAMLTTYYTFEKAIPVILKLKNLFSNLNFNTHKKSIAIFVSPVVERVYYLGVEMEEKIVIDPSFKIRDLVSCKKEKKEYLILQLSDNFSKMYLGNGTKLELIKSNRLINENCENIVSEKIAAFSVVEDQKEFITNKFLFQMDQGLSLILKSYPLPVFVIGSEMILEHFKKITVNDENLVQFIHGNYQEFSEAEHGCVIEHIVSSWKKLKRLHLFKQIKKAKTQNKLRTGVEEILKASTQNRAKLLIVEKKFVSQFQSSKIYNPFFRTDSPCNDFFIKNEVDDIIKNIFENGGDVEFIDDGPLKYCDHIALIQGN